MPYRARPGSYSRCFRFLPRFVAVVTVGVFLSLGTDSPVWACLSVDGKLPPFGGSGANPIVSAEIAAANRAAAAQGLQAPPAPPIGGTHKVLIILIENTSAGVTFAYPTASLWSSRITEMAGYYTEVSRGALTLAPATESHGTANDGVIGPVQVSSLNMSSVVTGANSPTLFVQAIRAANPYINYASYDTDNSGTIEADELHFLIYQAGDETSYFDSSAPEAWAHMYWETPRISGLFPATDSDGKNITSYSYCGSEFGGVTRATMGPMTHELGHDIGLPDLYDVDGADSGGDWSGLGYHSLMAGGSWGGSPAGSSPTHVDGFLKSWLGWAQVTSVTAPVNQGFALAAANGNNAVVRVAPSVASSQFFVIENRQQTGYDTGLPGSQGGLAVYHCDGSILTDTNIRLTNSINMNPTNAGIALEQADGSNSLVSGSWGSDADYFRAGNNSTFNASTNPNSNLKNGTPSGINVSNVSASGAVMTFDIGTATASFLFSPGSYSVSEAAGSVTVTVALTAAPGASTFTVQYATSNGTAVAGSDYTDTSGTLSFTGLETVKTFEVPLLNNGALESSETFAVTLSSPSSAVLGSPSSATITITDDDVDTDGDGISDYDETNGTLGFVTDPTLADSDGDFISDLDEIQGRYGIATNPTLSDTDGDGFDDRLELTFGFDPTDLGDFPLSLSEIRVPFFVKK